jgi:hypothetical protein
MRCRNKAVESQAFRLATSSQPTECQRLAAAVTRRGGQSPTDATQATLGYPTQQHRGVRRVVLACEYVSAAHGRRISPVSTRHGAAAPRSARQAAMSGPDPRRQVQRNQPNQWYPGCIATNPVNALVTGRRADRQHEVKPGCCPKIWMMPVLISAFMYRNGVRVAPGLGDTLATYRQPTRDLHAVSAAKFGPYPVNFWQIDLIIVQHAGNLMTIKRTR